MARLAKMNLNHAGENMGKAADNEAIKLRATYFNNLAVGTLLGGFVIPYIALFQRYPEDTQRSKQPSMLSSLAARI
jgi:hypothetical protein